ncbi:MAG: DUF5777 family beta-barrel protein [Bacteroidota bacterium]
MKKSAALLAIVVLMVSLTTNAQDKNWKTDNSDTSKFSKTFYNSRLINFHTVEVCNKRTMELRISHRFGAINGGPREAWGLDGGANIRIGLDYSLDGRLMVGIGRSSFQKMYDGFAKYRLVRQTKDGSTPVSVTLFSSAYYIHLKDPNKTANGFDKYEYSPWSRYSFTHEIIVARKFNDKFSLQVAPFFIHYNLVDKITDRNDVYGVASALRYKVAKRFAITAEYGLCLNNYTRDTYYNSMGIGFEIETGGHVFQVHFTNSTGITENQYLPFTNTKWTNAGIRLGFNLTRAFSL